MTPRVWHRLLFCMAVPIVLSGCASTVLLNAASGGNTTKVESQLAKGVDPNSKVPVLRIPAIVLAAAEGHLETVRTLVARGADVNASDATGWTALHAATRNGHKETVSFLLAHGAAIKPPTWYNPTPLHVAEKRGQPEILAMLKAAEDARRKSLAVRAEKIPSETEAGSSGQSAKD